MESGTWQLSLIGAGTLRSPQGAASALERKTAALLVYLALEGPTPRSKLAGLLWPESSEGTARNNLSQLLRRLRQSVGADVVEGGGTLQLRAGIDLDLDEQLLKRHDYDDCPDFADWLIAAREQLHGERHRQLRAQAEQLERTGELGQALSVTAQLLDLDPVSEETHRRSMRLHYLLGDRAAALAAYHRCQDVLRRELGVAPLPETQQLAREIEVAALTPAAASARRPLPLSVQRPPRLVGRAAAWDAMQQAWQEGRGIILSGAPGVGKSRLLHDFVAAHGRAMVFEGRPGDAALPYSTHARSFRALLGAFPDLPLPEWVRAELARLLPELAPTPPPLVSEADKLRFYQAKAEALALAVQAGLEVLAFDDLQFVDAASLEAGQHNLMHFWQQPQRNLRTLHCYRSGELRPETVRRLEEVVAAGLAVHIELAPLAPGDVEELLGSLDLPDLADWSEVARTTGGNPLFVLETVRHLWRGEPSARPGLLPGRVGALIGRRLARLSPEANKLARAAAVAAGNFSAELAGRMLERDPLDLADAWAELEAEQVLRGAAFTHDLLFETVRDATPRPLRELLHRRAACALEDLAAPPTQIALHWRASDDEAHAAPWLEKAADAARASFRLHEAADFYGQAASAHEAAGDTSAAMNALDAQASALLEADNGARHEEIVARMRVLARTPAQQVRALHAAARLMIRRRRGADAEALAREGLPLASALGDASLHAELLGDVALSLWHQGRLGEAALVYEDLIRCCQSLENDLALAEATNDLALVLDYQARRDEAARRYAQAEALFVRAGRLDLQATALSNWGGSLLQGGRAREATAKFRAALAVQEHVQGAPNVERRALTQLGGALRDLGEYAEALACLRRALNLARAHGLPRGYAHHALGCTWAALGRFEAAEAEFKLALDDLEQPADRVLVRLSQANLFTLAARGAAACGALDDAASLLGEGSPRTSAPRLLLWRARFAYPEAALSLIEQAHAQAQTAQHGGLEAAVALRRAQALLALGCPDQALAHAARAEELLRACVSPDVTLAEAQWTQIQARRALDDPAEDARTEACARLLDIAARHVLPEDREDFLHGHPVHRALLTEPGRVTPAGWGGLSDAHWARVADLLPAPQATKGRPPRPDREVLSGVLWVLAGGGAWKALPDSFPPASTCHRRFLAWSKDGTLTRLLRRLQSEPDGALQALLQQPGVQALLRARA